MEFVVWEENCQKLAKKQKSKGDGKPNSSEIGHAKKVADACQCLWKDLFLPAYTNANTYWALYNFCASSSFAMTTKVMANEDDRWPSTLKFFWKNVMSLS